MTKKEIANMYGVSLGYFKTVIKSEARRNLMLRDYVKYCRGLEPNRKVYRNRLAYKRYVFSS